MTRSTQLKNRSLNDPSPPPINSSAGGDPPVAIAPLGRGGRYLLTGR